MEIKAIIIDDEPLARQVIKEYARKIPTLTISGECEDAICAHRIIQDNQVDLLFLDINMPKLNGIAFLKTLKNPPLVIFTTAYSEYALDGFELNVVDYLKKPFSFERFCKAYFRAEELLLLKQAALKPDLVQKQNDFLFVKADKKTMKVKITDILYIEGLGDYIKLYMSDKKLITNLSMKKIENLLPPEIFYRIHKSFIISLDKIESIEGNMVKINNAKLPIGSLYRHDFMLFIKNFLAE
ncbi:MAG: two-component system response regulator LytR/AlgR [Prolixibacteraceae bacterium]|nr:MAG: two-component system response regulator LytR/AlgR [Prolixibacteraceae bacterium]